MSIQHFEVKPEFYEWIKGSLAEVMIPKIAGLFSYHVTSQIEYEVHNILEHGWSVAQYDLAQLAQTWQELAAGMSLLGKDAYLELFLRHPKSFSRFLSQKNRIKFEALTPQLQQDIIYAWYKVFKGAERDEAVFAGQNYYEGIQNVHGDVALFVHEFTKQRDFFEDTKNIRETEKRLGSIHMYQETTGLLTGLCMLYIRWGLPYDKLRAKLEELNWVRSLTPCATDVDRSDTTVHLMLDRLFSKEYGKHFDLKQTHEHIGISLYAWHFSHWDQVLTIANESSLALLVPSTEGDIQFSVHPDAHRYHEVFRIPADDILGLIELLHKLPGRSGATNRALLTEVITTLQSPDKQPRSLDD